MVLPSIADRIKAYFGSVSGPHDQDRSWEHCYKYLHENGPETIRKDRKFES